MLTDVGGGNVEVLDSNVMWEDLTFQARLSEDYRQKGPPQRAMLFTTEKLLEQLAASR